MFLDHSAHTFNPLFLPLVSFLISCFTSMGGVTGAFLLLPFQVSVLGFNSPAVSSTNQLYNIVAVPGGAYRYFREGRMVWPLAWAVILGTVPGVMAGTLIRINYLADPRQFKLFAAAVLLYLGGSLTMDIIRRKGGRNGNGEDSMGRKMPKVHGSVFSFKKISYRFNGEDYEATTMHILLISLAVGAVGGIYGLGGGAMMAPLFVSLFSLPVYTIAGAAMIGTFVTSLTGVAFYMLMAPFYPHIQITPDFKLGILFGIGGLAGTYLGARAQKYLPEKVIKCILAFCVLFIAARYLVESL